MVPERTSLKEERLKHQLNRRRFVTAAASVAALSITAAGLAGCATSEAADSANSEGGDGGTAEDTSPITYVFLPDSSSADMTESRDAFAEHIKAACGRDVEIMTTTDYNVAIEAIASGSAAMGSFGAEGYVQANTKNPKVQCCLTNSDDNGTLDEACYYSRICVRPENLSEYEDGNDYTLEPLEGGSFSFVSATSTSGFKVPSAKIVSDFGLDSNEMLLENGAFFSEVLLGTSHQGSLYNLVSGAADACAVDDTDVEIYVELLEGEHNRPGARYKIRDDAPDPFTDVHGTEFVVIQSTPVLNAPIVFNEEEISEEHRKAIVERFTSSVVSDDPRIFSDPDDEDAMALYVKNSPKTCFVEVSDEWYDPIRELG